MDRKIMNRALQVYGALLLEMVLFFIGAGTLEVLRGWLYFGMYFAYIVVNSAILLKRAPDLIRARSELKKGEAWDRYIIVAYTALSMFLLPYLAGLDAGRLLPEFSAEMIIIGVMVFVSGGALVTWSMLVNRYFEGSARIQKENGQTVISAGPYALIRHPGYLGMLLFLTSMVLIVGSAYAVIPAFALIAVMVVRTDLEDIMLRKKLRGYLRYSRRVRYRLIPHVW